MVTAFLTYELRNPNEIKRLLWMEDQMSSITNRYIDQARYYVRAYLSRFPRIFSYIYGLKSRNKNLLVGPKTELLIEGFPRSANTFSVLAFEKAQSRKVHVAHHMHSSAQIVNAVRFNIPILILIRNPIDSISSMVLRNKNLSISRLLAQYSEFHEAIYEYNKQFIVVDFNEVTSNFGQVIEKINTRFDVRFDGFKHDDNNISEVFNEVDRIEDKAKRLANERSRPSAEKELTKRLIIEEIRSQKYNLLLLAAESWYLKFKYLSEIVIGDNQ